MPPTLVIARGVSYAIVVRIVLAGVPMIACTKPWQQSFDGLFVSARDYRFCRNVLPHSLYKASVRSKFPWNPSGRIP